jgi:uracil-DNA glycosylase family 4
MEGSQRVLNRSAGALDADVMFIGEAPGRLGADASGIPFHGDRAGHNFEDLLSFARVDRSSIFVTNAVLCNPKDASGNNSPPSKPEIFNCSSNLKRQIEIVDPKIVVTLGGVALESSRLIAPHDLNLRDDVRTANRWFNRILIPFYHPGQRAMVHRSFANQRSDYQFLYEQLKRISKPRRKNYSGTYDVSIMDIIKYVISQVESLDYFKLHKIFYLCELKYFQEHGERFSNAYIVRQKDGPYCTDLHIQKIKKAIAGVALHSRGNHLLLQYSPSLLDEVACINDKIKNVVDSVIEKYASLSNEEIKTKVYLTSPMRRILRQEQSLGINVYNAPIHFESAT